MAKRNVKYTIEEARESFSKAGCVLLEDEYENCKTKMRFICKCGEEHSVCFSNFLTGYTQCKKCRYKQAAESQIKYSQEEVKDIFTEKGCELLTKCKNITLKTKLEYICVCGNRTHTTLDKLMRRKIGCARCAKNDNFTHEEVAEFYEKEGYKLLDQYVNINSSIRYICRCGRITKNTFGNFKHKEHRWCRKCWSEHNRGENHSRWNPDRDAVKLTKQIGARCSKILHRSLDVTNKKKTDRTRVMLGYTRKELKEHVTSHPNWDAVKDQDWQLDHVFPIKAFVEHNIKNLKVINALDNLAPMTAFDNISKGGKYDKREFMNYLKGKYMDKVLKQRNQT